MATVIERGVQGPSRPGSADNLGTRDVSPRGSDTRIAAEGKEQVKHFTGVTRDRVYHQMDSRKDELIQGLQGFVSTLEDASRNTDGFSQQVLHGAAGYVRKFSDHIENDSTEDLVREAKQLVREKPAPFFVGCIALGFLATRFLKE